MTTRLFAQADPNLHGPLPRFEDLVSVTLAGSVCLERARQFALGTDALLATGEPGTGKHTLARAIHGEGPYPNRAFFRVIACDPSPERSLGRILQETRLGTVYVHDLALATPALLAAIRAALESGDLDERGVRLVCATSRTLEEVLAHPRIAASGILPFLVARTLSVPPLRWRKGDIVPAFERALRHAARGRRHRIEQLSPFVCQALQAWPWPGNFTELLAKARRVAEHARDGTVRIEDLGLDPNGEAPRPMRLRPHVVDLDEMQLDSLVGALVRTYGDTAESARQLGLARSTVYAWIQRYKLDLRMFKSSSRRA